MTKENKTNELEKCTEIKTTELEQVTGGSFMFFYRDEDIRGAGVEVLGSGFLYDDGYRWRGMNISSTPRPIQRSLSSLLITITRNIPVLLLRHLQGLWSEFADLTLSVLCSETILARSIAHVRTAR